MGGFKYYNANPKHLRIGDCVIRAVSRLAGKEWDEIYMDLCKEGFARRDLPNADAVWGAYLRKIGYKKAVLPDTCPDCYTVSQFAYEHPKGKYLLALDRHVVAVEDGWYLDTWDCGQETILYYWTRKDEQ